MYTLYGKSRRIYLYYIYHYVKCNEMAKYFTYREKFSSCKFS